MYTGDTTLMCHQHLRTPFLNMRKLALIFKCQDLTLALDGIYISPRDDVNNACTVNLCVHPLIFQHTLTIFKATIINIIPIGVFNAT